MSGSNGTSSDDKYIFQFLETEGTTVDEEEFSFSFAHLPTKEKKFGTGSARPF